MKQKLENILRHIQHVRENCHVLGMKLIEEGEEKLGLELIANGLIHDNSKLRGIEWENLNQETLEETPLLFQSALKHHATLNPHHPEYWGHIKEMPKVFLAEMVCDIVARAGEFGTCVVTWLDTEALKKYDFNKKTKAYQTIKYFLNLLLERSFKNVKDKLG